MADQAIKSRLVDMLDELDGREPTSVTKRKEAEQVKIDESIRVAQEAIRQLGEYIRTMEDKGAYWPGSPIYQEVIPLTLTLVLNETK